VWEFGAEWLGIRLNARMNPFVIPFYITYVQTVPVDHEAYGTKIGNIASGLTANVQDPSPGTGFPYGWSVDPD
jgi:hypothetical protein